MERSEKALSLLQTGLVLSQEIMGNLNLPMHIGDVSQPDSKIIFWVGLKHLNWEMYRAEQLEVRSISISQEVV